MPLNRYGGYGGYGGSYSNYSSSYSSTYGRAGSASPATLRATTPSRAFGSNSIINTILPEDRTFKLSSYYSPSTYSRIYLNDYEKRDLKTIKTEELETSVENRENNRNHAIPGEITRDTTLNIRGGKPVVRIVTQKAKENPYINNPGWRSRVKEEEEKNSLTLGQRLALKHQIAEKPKPSESSAKKTESGEESEWTWETCSSSSQEQEGYEYKVAKSPPRVKTPPPPVPARRTPVVYSKSNTTTLCSTEDNKSIKPPPSTPATPNNAIRNRWLDTLTDPKPKSSTERIPNFGSAVSMNKNLLGRQLSGSGARPVSWAGSQPQKPASSSGSSSSSPPLYKYNPSKTTRPRTIISSSDEEEAVGVGPGWRPGQPPRGEVVVKLTNNKKKPVIDSQHSNAKLTNQVLTSDTVISSKVPGNMNEKYSIPGLFIKPSTKVAPKSVEAKLTLSPVEGTFSLTTKVKEEKEKGSYQSAIFTPTKSPLLDSRNNTKSLAESSDSKDKAVTAPFSSVCLVKTEAAPHSEEESEWEYYTETEPSDTELPPQESQTSEAQTKTEKADDSKTKESVLPPTISHIQKSNNITTSVPANVSKANLPSQSKPQPPAEKHPLEIKTAELTEKKSVSKINVDVKKSVVETKTIPPITKLKDKVEKNNDRDSKEAKNTSNYVDVTGVRQTQTKDVDNKTKGQARPTELKIEQNKNVDKNKPTPLIAPHKLSKLAEQEPGYSALRSTAVCQEKHERKSSLDIKSDAVTAGKKENSTKVTTTDGPKVKSIPVTTTDSSKLDSIAITKTDDPKVKSDTVTNTNDPIIKSISTTSTDAPKIKSIPVSPNDATKTKIIPVKNAETQNTKSIPVTPNEATKTKTTVKTTETPNPKITPLTPNDVTKTKTTVKTVENPNVKITPVTPKDITKTIPLTNTDSPKVKSISTSLNDDPMVKCIPVTEKKLNDQINDKAAAIIKNAEEAAPTCEEYKTDTRTSSPENNMPATSLERLPSPLKNMFSGTVSPKSSPENAPKWYNNTPVEDPNFINPTKAITQMKNDVNKQVEKQIKQEQTLIKISDKADSPWYSEEDDDMKDLLQKRPSILKEIDLNQDRRLTPEENTAVIKMYGGVMFPGGFMEKTPKNLLFKVRKSARTESLETQKLRDSGFESQRANSTGSNSSTISSFTAFSETPSPAHTDDSDDSSDSGDEEKIKKNPINQAPTKSRPEFKKYLVRDFRFLKVLGKGSFGKVLLAELRNSQNYYAVKALRKDSVLEDDDIECTMIERKVLALGVKHPFLCHLFCTLQTDSHLFFVMEYLNGGDLMFHIQQSGRFDTERARFYSAEIVCALKFLHRKGIVYRDLKLDNLLLDYEGHIRLVDFGMCKLQIYLDKTSDTFCGTPDYMAPEIIKGMKYTHSVDWWSFGVLLYEMLIGQSPFNGCDEDELFWSICNEQAYFPRFLSKETKAILLLLLEKNPAKRLGVSESFHGEIRHQPFFKPIDFAKLERKQISPPYKPKLKNPLDVSYFDTAFTDEPVKLTPVESDFLNNLNQVQFKGFSYTNRPYTQIKS